MAKNNKEDINVNLKYTSEGYEKAKKETDSFNDTLNKINKAQTVYSVKTMNAGKDLRQSNELNKLLSKSLGIKEDDAKALEKAKKQIEKRQKSETRDVRIAKYLGSRQLEQKKIAEQTAILEERRSRALQDIAIKTLKASKTPIDNASISIATDEITKFFKKTKYGTLEWAKQATIVIERFKLMGQAAKDASKSTVKGANDSASALSKTDQAIMKVARSFLIAKEMALTDQNVLKQFHKFKKEMEGFSIDTEEGKTRMAGLNNQVKLAQNGYKGFFKALTNVNTAMSFFGVMFQTQMLATGMQRMITTTVESFKTMTGSLTTQGQALIKLGAYWDFLKFTIGNAIATALEPFIPTIVKIIETLAEFISEHPKLFAFGALFGFLALKILSVVSAAVLMISSFTQIAKGFGLFGSIANIAGKTATDALTATDGALITTSSNVKGLGSSILSFLVSPWGIALVAMTAVFGYALTQSPELSSALKDIGTNTIKSFGTVLTSIWNVISSLVGGLFPAIKEGDSVWIGMGQIIGAIFALAGAGVQTVLVGFTAVFDTISNGLKILWQAVYNFGNSLYDLVTLDFESLMKDAFTAPEFDFSATTKSLDTLDASLSRLDTLDKDLNKNFAKSSVQINTNTVQTQPSTILPNFNIDQINQQNAQLMSSLDQQKNKINEVSNNNLLLGQTSSVVAAQEQSNIQNTIANYELQNTKITEALNSQQQGQINTALALDLTKTSNDNLNTSYTTSGQTITAQTDAYTLLNAMTYSVSENLLLINQYNQIMIDNTENTNKSIIARRDAQADLNNYMAGYINYLDSAIQKEQELINKRAQAAEAANSSVKNAIDKKRR